MLTNAIGHFQQYFVSYTYVIILTGYSSSKLYSEVLYYYHTIIIAVFDTLAGTHSYIDTDKIMYMPHKVPISTTQNNDIVAL